MEKSAALYDMPCQVNTNFAVIFEMDCYRLEIGSKFKGRQFVHLFRYYLIPIYLTLVFVNEQKGIF